MRTSGTLLVERPAQVGETLVEPTRVQMVDELFVCQADTLGHHNTAEVAHDAINHGGQVLDINEKLGVVEVLATAGQMREIEGEVRDHHTVSGQRVVMSYVKTEVNADSADSDPV